jgi:hypothetical protein
MVLSDQVLDFFKISHVELNRKEIRKEISIFWKENFVLRKDRNGIFRFLETRILGGLSPLLLKVKGAQAPPPSFPRCST